MKTKLILCLFAILTNSCSQNENENKNEYEIGRFVIIEEKTMLYDIVYDKHTKVMYIMSDAPYNHGNFTVLIDENGKPLLYKEKKRTELKDSIRKKLSNY